IDSMTGGYEGAEKINRTLATAAAYHNIPFSFGSMRAMIKNPAMARTFNFRYLAPDIPIIGNIGIANLPTTPVDQIEGAAKKLDLDALYVHFNPLQEAVMMEGDRNFEGVADSLAELCDKVDIPVIAKETGAGMSDSAAKRLSALGVSMLNVSGSGGTSWSKVEYARKGYVPGFEEWGIPTALSIALCSKILPTIASGGIRNGIDIAKSVALGAVLAGSAMPFLKAEDPAGLIAEWKLQLKTAMFLANAPDMARLGRARVVVTGRLSEQFYALGIDHFSYSRR
ncbi:MAG TPA: alpha-hydroxy-acid oxidizing protein, partial [Candidatus Micrarchaeota archaeon]|nr:alpha-hydroxy-acid oxidizing protein [Candidatus Micrarchaeota archaeon]